MLLKGMTEEEIANILDVDINIIIKVEDNMNQEEYFNNE